MNLKLQLVFVVSSLITIIFVIRQIRKYGLNIEDSIIWIIWSLLLLFLSLFPVIADKVSEALGFISTSNFILSLFMFFLYLVVFLQMVQISKLKEKQKELIQKLSISKYSEENASGKRETK